MTPRNFWARDYPIGDPTAGPPYGQRNDGGAVSPSTMGTVSQGAGVLGTIMSFMGNMGAGDAAKRAATAQKTAADFEAAQLRQNAGQVEAAAQRDSMDQNLRAKLLASRAAAVAAAGGGALTDPSVAKIIADISGRGSYNAATALYQGEEAARKLNLSATAKTLEGNIALQGGADRASAYDLRAFGSLATGSASLFSKYGAGGFKSSTPGDYSTLDV